MFEILKHLAFIEPHDIKYLQKFQFLKATFNFFTTGLDA